MTKVSDSYESVVRGVSEQVPQDRRSGQHFEQVNMISDPVRGLARRHGSVLQDEKIVAAYNSVTHGYWLEDTARHRVFPFFANGVKYDLIYRTIADTHSLGAATFAFAFNKATRVFMPVVLHADTATLQSGGVSSIVNVGKYLFIAGNTIVPSFTPTDKWGATANKQKMAVWVLDGAYSRTYKVTVRKTDNTKISVTYTTKASSYPTLLDTSALNPSDADYADTLNQALTNYQSLVTQWIGLAAADITPQNIAAQLSTLLNAAGVTGTTSVDGTVCIDNVNYTEVYAEDGGDGAAIRAVGAEVSNIDLVSNIHYPGKIVKIRPKKNNGEDALYLKAVAKEGVTSFGAVTWRECAGYEMLPTAPFCIGTVKSGTLYIAATPATLTSLTGDASPAFKVNEVGDDITCPLPYFISKNISYLGLFQDRLVIGSGAVLFFSRPGDYFNWFRGSVLTVQDTDPVEQYALGAEDDTIIGSVAYDKNLVLFGQRHQYAINGRAPVSLKNPLFILSSHENAVDALPIDSGNFVFYSKARNNVSSAHQLQVGNLADSPESFQISQQLDRYLAGKPVEMLAVTSPNHLFLRTDGARNTLYTYAYLDTATGSERLFDSWSKWVWNTKLGDIIGISRDVGDILVYLLRHGIDRDGNEKVWVAAELFVLDTSLSPRPYMDSLRVSDLVLTPGANAFVNPASDLSNDAYIAYGYDAGVNALLGSPMSDASAFVTQYPTAPLNAWIGIHYDAYATPTNPYIRDSKGNAIVNGLLTVGQLSISVADTAGLSLVVTSFGTSDTVADFSGRVLGQSVNLIGQQPVVATTVTGLVGSETRQFSYTLRAKNFLPLTVTAIEWVGQYFNNTRRV